MSDKPFWMVYGEGQRPPAFKHATFESARLEAERLARLLPGVRFYVLSAIARALKADVDFQPIEGGDDIPF